MKTYTLAEMEQKAETECEGCGRSGDNWVFLVSSEHARDWAPYTGQMVCTPCSNRELKELIRKEMDYLFPEGDP